MSAATTSVALRPGGPFEVPGFRSAGLHAGLKRKGHDVGLLFAEGPAAAAGVFTRNRTAAAPVVLSKQHLGARATHRAVVVNSGCANACTGSEGWENARAMAAAAADALGVSATQVLVASTGVIGKQLDMGRLVPGIGRLGADLARGRGNAHFPSAILTTDTRQKTAVATVEVGGCEVTLAGAAKGSGMIHPNMATMLGFVATDAAVSRGALAAALGRVTRDTFNMISVDGDTSTNDCVFALSSGRAGNTPIGAPRGRDFQAFEAALEAVCRDLAVQIVRDGEGATRVFSVKVTGARSEGAARAIAKSVARSNLVKCAVHGADPNWGRIVAAAGYADVPFEPSKARVSVANGSQADAICLFDAGTPAAFDEEEAHELLTKDTLSILLELRDGRGRAEAWGCDFSHDYVTINAHYRT
ncbi:MAG TPA: bifunctional glutamate N-acetyltransferase/amino-acid acetyltransferase ArgJ [Candidatus Thermoplasmatota archaeon]